MLVHIPDHFSSRLKFNIQKQPCIVTDRTSPFWGICGCIFGTLLLWLGIFELFSFLKAEKTHEQSFLLVEIFAFIIMLIALGLIIYSFFSFIRYKKFYFDGKEFQIIYRPAIGIKHVLREPLSNYIGVRLRVLFIQSGLRNKNRYIIDLYHSDNNKIVPLYISTKNKDIRKIWENYARIFNMPALSIGDRGLIRRECEDLDKSIKELASANKLPLIASGKLPAPDSLDIIEKRNSTIVSPTGIYWDMFSSLLLFISIAAMLILVAGGVYLAIIDNSFPLKYYALGLFLLAILVYSVTRLFKFYVLIIEDTKISVQEMLFNSVIKTESLDLNTVENIELSYNPSIGCYSLSIVSDDKIVTFGSRLPVEDLLWLKDFTIRKLIGN